MKELSFFIALFAFFFVLWLATGGPNRPTSFTGPYLRPVSTTGTTAQPYGSPSAFSSLNRTITVGVQGVDVNQNASGSRGLVSFSRDLSGATQSDPQKEYVVITYAASAKEPLSTAGWKLISRERNKTVGIPQGTETPRSGRVNALTPITLRPGDQMIVSTGRSPVGISFRENKCSGYFEEHQDFHPSLSQNCPTPYQEFSRFGKSVDTSGACAQYVSTIPYCATETRMQGGVSSTCQQFVEDRLNYNGCVTGHENDSDFLGNTWRVFLGESDELWTQGHETIVLLDAQNKVVDSITY